MESKIILKKSKKKIKYPCLMILFINGGSAVVLAHKNIDDKNFSGTVLINNTSELFEVGSYEEDWCIEDFSLFEGSIILKN